jgi:predicted RND superfamily exporter protein
MKFTFRAIAEPICRSSSRHPLIWLVATLLLSVPAVLELGRLDLDTNLVRLLPNKSPAAFWTRQLQTAVSDEGYFTILFQSPDKERILPAVKDAAERVRALEGVYSAEYEYPLEFISRFRYLLIPDYYLAKTLDYLIGLEAEANPVGSDLLADPDRKSAKARKEDEEMDRLLDQYSRLTPYHQSADGRVMGLFIRPRMGLDSLAELRRLWLDLEDVARQVGRKHGLWTGVGGSQIENLKEYHVIVSDLNVFGTIATISILLVLLFSFRSVLVIPPLLYPLGLGLLWSFALVPPLLGSLNIITCFLILVLFGMGIDFSIHLVKRFQVEIATRPVEEALLETYVSTGSSMMISGLNTALALFVLAFFDFRGFSEYGLICGLALTLTILAMLVVMPATLVLGSKLRLIKPLPAERQKGALPPRWLSWVVGGAVLLSVLGAGFGLRFDYDFNSLKPDSVKARGFDEKNRQVYARYMSPGAVYIASDMASLDGLLAVLKKDMARPGSLVQRVTNIRDFAPSDAQTAERLALLGQIKEQVAGRWTRRIDDPKVRRWIEDLRAWKPPARQPAYEELPTELREGLEARDGSGRFLVGVYPNVPRGNGRNAMKFTRELYGLKIPAGIKGPVGEMPIFAEILWIIAAEGPWVVALTFLCVILLVFVGNWSLRQTGWTILPLLGGLVLTFGVMALFRVKLNFFNVVVIPTLIGLGEDHGVHYYRRWRELRGDTAATHRELLGPLTLCTLTTMFGYSGMLFAHHPGLRSIGLFACLGMTCIWLTSLVFFPLVLRIKSRRVFPPSTAP